MNSANKISWDQLTAQLKSGQMVLLEELYNMYRLDFLRFGQKYPCDEDLLLDIYQDSVLALYENIVHDRIKSHSATIKTYLFSIGRYKILNHLRSQRKFVSNEQLPESETYIESQIFEEVKNQKLASAISQLGETCKKLLVMSFYQGLKNEDILELMDYKNDQTLRANKSRCLRKLRERMIKQKNPHANNG